MMMANSPEIAERQSEAGEEEMLREIRDVGESGELVRRLDPARGEPTQRAGERDQEDHAEPPLGHRVQRRASRGVSPCRRCCRGATLP